MEIVKGILIVLHLVGFGVVFGSTLAQFPQVKRGTARITPGILHGANLLFVTGLLLVGMVYALGGQPNNLKITVKLLVLIVMIVMILVGRKKQPVPAGILGTIAGLSLLNVTLAVLW
ncbi:hypothetical protein J4H92_09475 [Leucobacter weissii]|uniref:Uncharacterized protein n=1 Tax=Leucobacter weissii TaxID=1983706 RepID=A0A939MLM9_9MICO|nr:hypothetical protein [Leucobacter weissii]MBO1902175.1 hypothetical protein [Leucobacter weissii]